MEDRRLQDTKVGVVFFGFLLLGMLVTPLPIINSNMQVQS